MERETIVISRDWRTGRIVYCKPSEVGWFQWPDLNEATEWDGRGFATLHESVMRDRIFQRAPEIGDVIEVDGRSLVIVDYAPMSRSYRVLTESLEAHRLALFYITYWSDFEARMWPIRAYQRLNAHFIQDVQDQLMQGAL